MAEIFNGHFLQVTTDKENWSNSKNRKFTVIIAFVRKIKNKHNKSNQLEEP